MADVKLSALTALGATPASGDELYIRDVSEAAADESKRIVYSDLVPTTSARIATGTYTGDGETSQAITGVGFAPKVVWITVRQTAEGSFTEREVVMTTDVIVDDIAAGAHLNFAVNDQVDILDNGIISLNADGFTVDDNGADTDPNTNSETYNYWAFG